MKFNIISHTHWDREWHKTFEEYRARLISFFDNLIELLETDQEYKSFLMDGQTIVLEDYLKIKPFKKKQLEKLIKNRRIIIGPWYIQPDEFIPSGEMQIRNLLIGQIIGEEFGENMQIGYLPDSFGQSAQIPQLLNGFDIEHAVFWRGLTEEECTDLDFIWKSADGSSVKTTFLAGGYGNARMLNGSIENNVSIIKENIKALYERSNKKNLLLMCGFDQRNANPILPKIVQELNEYYKKQFEPYSFSISTIQEYMDEVFKDGNKKIISGEFRKGKHMRVHVSIGLTRSDIKQANYQSQTFLIKKTEPLMSFASFHGFEYQKELINQATKYILQNQAHDSITNVCTDSTHREMSMRYENANQIARILINDALESLTNNIAFQDIGVPIVLYNLTSSRRNGLERIAIITDLSQFEIVDASKKKVNFDIISKKEFNQNDMQIEIGIKNKDVILYQYELILDTNFEGFGYKTNYLVKKANLVKIEKKTLFNVKTNAFTTKNFTLQIENDGTLSYLDKITEERFINLNVFLENGSAGDEYDYSPPKNDKVYTAHNKKPDIQVIYNSDKYSVVKMVYNFDVPAMTLADYRSEEMLTQTIESEVFVKDDGRRIDFKTTINNQARNHRISVQFDNNQLIDTHFSEQQFGPITRKNIFKNPNQWIDEKWEERYYPIYPQQRYTGFNNKDNKMVIFNKGLVTYEIIDNDGIPAISIPLITTMDYMGKQDLVDRPGRRSGLHIRTPDSEMIGEYTYEYSLFFFNDEVNLISEADSYQLPIYIKQPIKLTGNLEEEQILYTVESKNIDVMSFKKSENSEEYVLKLVNHNEFHVNDVRVKLNPKYFNQIVVTNFKEQEIRNGAKVILDGSILKILQMNANEVITLKLKSKGN